MTTRRPRTAVLAALALAASAALAGCAQIQQWTGEAPGPGDAGPTATATPTPSPGTSGPTSEPDPTATPTATPTVTPTVTPTATPTPTPSGTPTPTGTATPDPVVTAVPEALRYGDEGAEVRALQRRLVELGYWLGVRDGSFGPLTQQAVFAFQKSAGLDRDGVVGPRTRAALAQGARPTASLSGDGVEIDLSRQILMVVRDGRPSLVLNTSTGSGQEYTSTSGHQAIATTPTGTYRVFREVDGPDDSELGALWRPKYFHRGYAVHGSPDVPPYPASHGCARVSDAAIDMIWDRGLMDIGTTVLVHG